MRFSVEVEDLYRSQCGYKERTWWNDSPGGPIWSEVTAGPIRAGELVQAASMAVAQLGELAAHIESVELSFEKPALANVIWPHFVVTTRIPQTTQKLVIRATAHASVHSSGPFPTDEFITAMVGEVKGQITLQIEQLRSAIARVEDSLPMSAQAEVA